MYKRQSRILEKFCSLVCGFTPPLFETGYLPTPRVALRGPSARSANMAAFLRPVVCPGGFWNTPACLLVGCHAPCSVTPRAEKRRPCRDKGRASLRLRFCSGYVPSEHHLFYLPLHEFASFMRSGSLRGARNFMPRGCVLPAVRARPRQALRPAAGFSFGPIAPPSYSRSATSRGNGFPFFLPANTPPFFLSLSRAPCCRRLRSASGTSAPRGIAERGHFYDAGRTNGKPTALDSPRSPLSLAPFRSLHGFRRQHERADPPPARCQPVRWQHPSAPSGAP